MITLIVTANDGYSKVGEDDLRVGRDYDFNMGDERRTQLSLAIDVAQQRAKDTDTDQQVRETTGATGVTLWLIQAVDRDVQIPLENKQLDLGHIRRLAHRSRHLPDSAPIAIEPARGHDGLALVAHDVE